MVLTDGTLAVREAEPADAERLAAWWNDGAVMAHAGFPLGLGTTAEEVAASLQKADGGESRRLILELDGRPVGEMSWREKETDTAEIGIKICEASFQERGLGRRALSLLIRHLFADLGYGRIVLDTDLENRRAQHVYKLLGFRRMGVRRDCWRDQLGRPRSAVDYELRPEMFHSFLT